MIGLQCLAKGVGAQISNSLGLGLFASCEQGAIFLSKFSSNSSAVMGCNLHIDTVQSSAIGSVSCMYILSLFLSPTGLLSLHVTQQLII